MRIRYARMMDKDDIYKLFCNTYHTTLKKNTFEDMLWENINNPFMSCLVLVEDEMVVGFVTFTILLSIQHIGKVARLEEFLVSERREEVARLLFEEVLQRVRKLECLHMEMNLMDHHILSKLDEIKKKAVKISTIYQFPM